MHDIFFISGLNLKVETKGHYKKTEMEMKGNGCKTFCFVFKAAVKDASALIKMFNPL